MIGRYFKAAALILAVGVCLFPARAQDSAAVAGTYCLQGVREVGSCVRLSDGGKFEYFLAYGAYDEKSEGTWRLTNGEVVVDSLPYDKRPIFIFKRMQRGETDAFDIVVQNKGGRTLQGIDVGVTCDGKSSRVGTTGAGGYKVDCTTAPTTVSLGLGMYGVAPQALSVSAPTGAEKIYVFEFDPGDLGKKRFIGQRLRIKGGDALEMVYDDTPIGELRGRPFEYVRSR